MEAKSISRRTPFLCAAIMGHVKILKVLCKEGANIRAKDKNGKNALEIIPPSSKLRCKEVIEYLEELGLGVR